MKTDPKPIAHWTATEAITFLAFGSPTPAQDIRAREHVIWRRWGSDMAQAEMLLDRLDGTAVLSFDGLQQDDAIYIRERQNSISAHERLHDLTELRELLCDDVSFQKSMQQAARDLVEACRSGLVTPWGTLKSTPTAAPSYVPRTLWVRGVVIFRDAMSAGSEGSMEEYARVRAMNRWLYEHLTFDSREVRGLRGPTSAGSSTASSARRGGADYRLSDEILVAEGVKGVLSGTYATPLDAAFAMAPSAKGKGSLESRAKRLVTRIRSGVQAVQS